ncbi:MAG: hypothetical protein IT319_03860 [Anaerolineae bacterium]|nr:hypothetical protein [Anaerolineae bacterium]
MQIDPFPAFQPASPCEMIRLSDDWQAQPVPMDATAPISDTWLRVPECAHLQPRLYPDQPYWGDHLRAINQQAWLYRRTFPTPAGDFRRARLRFEGVDYFADVWVNDSFVGRHEGHFLPFEFDITPYLRRDSDETTLTVRVTAPWDAPNPSGTYPSDHVVRGLVKGLYEHGEGVIPPAVNPVGIWRPVWLLLDQGISIDHLRIRTELDGMVDLRLRLTNVTGTMWHGCLDLAIGGENHDGAGVHTRFQVTLAPGTHALDHELRIPDPRWWWCWDQGAPNLYRLDARLLDERGRTLSAKSDCFGVRTIRLERSPERFTYWLNERPVFVRGSSYMPALYLSQTDEHLLARDVALARDANLNLLRLHVHVSPPEVYGLCDRAGMLVWQDFELNWVQDPSPEFETRAVEMQRGMIDLLGNHPSIITWACHNEPTMVFARRANMERRPDPALYADACQRDPTRPVFLCSGQLEDDWQRAGDAHTYYGAIWTRNYADIYRRHPRLVTEFGFETPAAAGTLRAYPDVWERLKHLEGEIDELWAYQAALIQYHVEHFRRLRADSCGGYVHFWLADLVPQVGCGVLDACRAPKGGYAALKRASQPLLPMLEYDGRQPVALWVLNDTPRAYSGSCFRWRIDGFDGGMLEEGQVGCDVAANASQRVLPVRWTTPPSACARIRLWLYDAAGDLLSANEYDDPFHPRQRPTGYPWKFDSYLGTKVFDRPGATSLADHGISPALRLVPLRLREQTTEWVLRQRLPTPLVSLIARIGDGLMG